MEGGGPRFSSCPCLFFLHEGALTKQGLKIWYHLPVFREETEATQNGMTMLEEAGLLREDHERILEILMLILLLNK